MLKNCWGVFRLWVTLLTCIALTGCQKPPPKQPSVALPERPRLTLNDLNNGQAWEKVVNSDPKEVVSLVYDEYVTKHNGRYFFEDRGEIRGHLGWASLFHVVEECLRHAADPSGYQDPSRCKKAFFCCAKIMEITSHLNLPEQSVTGSTSTSEPVMTMSLFLNESSGLMDERIDQAVKAGVFPRDIRLSKGLDDLFETNLGLTKKLKPSIVPIQRARNHALYLREIPHLRSLISSVVKDLAK